MAKFKADFSNVGEGPGLSVPDGDYICKVSKITVEQGDKGKYLKWEFTVGSGEHKGTKIYDNTSLTPQSLFNLRNTILACGIEVPKSAFAVDTDKYISKIVGITTGTREYTKDGKKKQAVDVVDKWRAVKGPKGWGRVNAKDDVEDELVGEETAEEEVEEIEI
jgi:hypothetical protein